MKHICLLCGMMWLALSASAQSLDECRRLAREHYPEIRQYDLITQTEQYNLSNAAKAWIPQVTISGQATYQSAAPTYPFTQRYSPKYISPSMKPKVSMMQI